MIDRTGRTTAPPASDAERTRHGALLAATSPGSDPHDGLLLLAALTGHRGLLTAWLRAERARERAGAAGVAGAG
jgi:hypothetical protein